MKSNIATRTVTFSNGTVKNASLLIPAGPCSIVQIVECIRESFFNYMFRPGCGLMSDEVLVSSIGHSSFMEGALSGFETRLDEKSFKMVKDYLMSDSSQAIAAAEYRNPNLSKKEAFLKASENEALSETDRAALRLMATVL